MLFPPRRRTATIHHCRPGFRHGPVGRPHRQMTINISDGKHSYDFDYTLPEARQ
jgi:hypothetical protein